MMRLTVRLLSFTAAVLFSPLCFFGVIGLSGRLIDAGRADNVSIGLSFLLVWFVVVLPALLTFVPWRQLAKWFEKVIRFYDRMHSTLKKSAESWARKAKEKLFSRREL